MALFRALTPKSQPAALPHPPRSLPDVSLRALWSTPSGPAAFGEMVEAASGGNSAQIDLVGVAGARTGSDGPGGADGGGEKEVAASDKKEQNTAPDLAATGLAHFLFAVGLVVAVLAFDTTTWGPTYTPTEGVGVFALFYIVAQAVERFVEMAMPVFERVDSFNKASKQVELDQLVEEFYAQPSSLPSAGPAANRAQDAAKAAANKQAEIDQLRANRTVIMFGLAAGLGMALCGYLEADFLTSVGANFGPEPNAWQQALMMAVTGLIVGGGSKQLHDLITNVSKAKDQKSTPAETGGQR